MKKLLIFMITLSTFISLSCTKENDTGIKIGIILPLTGGGAEWGEHSKNAYELALSNINKKYPNLDIKLFFDDSKTETKTALNIFNKFNSIQNIDIVMGLLVSSNVLAIAPIAEKERVLIISNGASNPDISNAGDYIFRTWQSDALEGTADVNFALDSLGWTNIAILYSENGYGKGLADAFTQQLNNNGVDAALTESFKIGQKDFKNLIAKLNSKEIDGIYLASYPTESSLLLKQFVEQKSQYPILGTQGFDDPIVKEVLPLFNEAIYYSIPMPPDTNQIQVKNFRSSYFSKYGQEPGLTADAAYDALMIIAQGLQKYGDDREKIKNYLYSVKNYPGVSGNLTFNKYGDVEKPFIFKKIIK